MDAREYDRIADLLTQIHRKISSLNVIKSSNCRDWHEVMLQNLQDALKANDQLGEYASKGWIE